jgi:chromosome segregation and condensation protein ScpB
MNKPPQPTEEIAAELLSLIAYHSPITTYTARHELSRWLGWSVWYPEYSQARSQLIELGLINFDRPPGSGEITITDNGMDTLERREKQ